MPVPIRQIAEVAIVVRNLERSVRFYHEVLGLPIWERHDAHATLRLANGFLGLWLPGAWTIPGAGGSPPIALEGGARQHLVFYIDLGDADEALANLQRLGVRYFGPRVKECAMSTSTSRTRMGTCSNTGRAPASSRRPIWRPEPGARLVGKRPPRPQFWGPDEGQAPMAETARLAQSAPPARKRAG